MAISGQRLLTMATRNDWAPVLASLEDVLSVKYVESGTFSEANPLEYARFQDIPRFGEALWGEAVQERRYLIMKKDSPVYFRSVRMNTGETRYVADHGNNPDSVVFSAGGVLEIPQAVVQGEVSKLSTTASAEEIFRLLSGFIKRHFPAIRAYRVGSEALSLKGKGYRLTASVHSPREYDLEIDRG